MSGIKILKCDFDDPAHQRALVQLMNHYITDKMGGSEPLSGKRAEELIQGLRDLPTSIVLFAVEDDRFIGLCNAFVNFATFTVKKFVNIHDIVVLNDYRGKGIGRKLMQAVIDVAVKLDCSKVTLEVREDNVVAQGLYQSLGFKECTPKMYFWTKTL